MISHRLLDALLAPQNPGAPHSIKLNRPDNTVEYAHVYALTFPVRCIADETCISSVITSKDPSTLTMRVDPAHSTFMTVMMSIMMALPRVHGARDDTTSLVFQMFPVDRLKRVWEVPAVRFILHYIAPRAAASTDMLKQTCAAAEEVLMDTSKMTPSAVARQLFKVVTMFSRSPSKLFVLYKSMDALKGSNLSTPLNILFPYMSPTMHDQMHRPLIQAAFFSLVDDLFHQRNGVNAPFRANTTPSFRAPPPAPYPGEAISVGAGTSTPFYGFAEISGKALSRVPHMRTAHPHYFATGAVAHVRTFADLMDRSEMKCPDLMATPSVITDVLMQHGSYVDLLMSYVYSTDQLQSLGVDKETIDPYFFFPTKWNPSASEQPHSTPAETPMNEHLSGGRLMISPRLYLPNAADRLRLSQMEDRGRALLHEVRNMCETDPRAVPTNDLPMAARMMIWSIPAPYRYASILMRRPQILPRWSDPEHMIMAMHNSKDPTGSDPVVRALLKEIARVVPPISTDINSFNKKYPMQSYITRRRAYHSSELCAALDRLASNASACHGKQDPTTHNLSTLPRHEVVPRSQYEAEGCLTGAALPWIRAVAAVSGDSKTPEQPLDDSTLDQVAAEVVSHYVGCVDNVRSAVRAIGDIAPSSICSVMAVKSSGSGHHEVFPRTSATAQGRAQVAGTPLPPKLATMQADSAVFPASTPGAYSDQLSPLADLYAQLASELTTKCNMAGDKLVHVTMVVCAATSSGDVPSAVHIGVLGPTTCGKTVGLRVVKQLAPVGAVINMESVSAMWLHNDSEARRFRPFTMNEINWKQIGNSASGDSDGNSEQQRNFLTALEEAWTDGTRLAKSTTTEAYQSSPYHSNTQIQVFYSTNTMDLQHAAAVYARVFAYRMNAMPDQLTRPLDLSALNDGNFISAYRRMWRSAFELNLLMNTGCMPTPSTGCAVALFKRFINAYKAVIKTERLDPVINASVVAFMERREKFGNNNNKEQDQQPIAPPKLAKKTDERFTLNRQILVILESLLPQMVMQRVLLTVTQHMQPFFAAMPGITVGHLYTVIGAYMISRPDDAVMSFLPISLLDRRYVDRCSSGVAASKFSGIVESFVMFLVRMAELIRDAAIVKSGQDLDSTLRHISVDPSHEKVSLAVRHTPNSVLRAVLAGDVDSVFSLTRMDTVDADHENFRWILLASMRFYRITSTMVSAARQTGGCKVNMVNSSKKYHAPLTNANITVPDDPEPRGLIRTDDVPFVYAHCLDAAMSSLGFFTTLENVEMLKQTDEKVSSVEAYPIWNARMVRVHKAASASHESFSFIIPASTRVGMQAFDPLGENHRNFLRATVPHEVMHTWALSDLVMERHGWRARARSKIGLRPSSIDMWVGKFEKWNTRDLTKSRRAPVACPSVGLLLPRTMRQSFVEFKPLRDAEINALDPCSSIDVDAIVDKARAQSGSSSSSSSSSPVVRTASNMSGSPSQDERMVSGFTSYRPGPSSPVDGKGAGTGEHSLTRVTQMLAIDALGEPGSAAIEISVHRLNRFVAIIPTQTVNKPFADTPFPHVVFDAKGTMELGVPPSVEAMRRVISDHMNPVKGDALLWRYGCSAIAAPIRADGATVIDIPTVPEDDPRLKRTTVHVMGKMHHTSRYLRCLLESGDTTQGMNDLTNTGECAVRRDADIANYRMVHQGTHLAATAIILKCATAHHMLRCNLKEHTDACNQDMVDIADEADDALLYGPKLRDFCRDRLGAVAKHSHPYPNVAGHVDHRQAVAHSLEIGARDNNARLARIRKIMQDANRQSVHRQPGADTAHIWRKRVARAAVEQKNLATAVFSEAKEAALATAELVRRRELAAAEAKKVASAEARGASRARMQQHATEEARKMGEPNRRRGAVQQERARSALLACVREEQEQDDNRAHEQQMARIAQVTSSLLRDAQRERKQTSSHDDESGDSDVDMPTGSGSDIGSTSGTKHTMNRRVTASRKRARTNRRRVVSDDEDNSDAE